MNVIHRNLGFTISVEPHEPVLRAVIDVYRTARKYGTLRWQAVRAAWSIFVLVLQRRDADRPFQLRFGRP